MEIINFVPGNALTMELSRQDVVDMASTVLKGNVASQIIKGEMPCDRRKIQA